MPGPAPPRGSPRPARDGLDDAHRASGRSETGPEPARTGGRLVADYLAAQRDALLTAAPGARRGDPDAVHEMRTATRRLRSTLRTFRPLWSHDATEPLRTELRWLGGLLGAVRDTDVLAEILAAAIGAADPALLVGPVADRVGRQLAVDAEAARAGLAHALTDDRYALLLDRLATLVAAPAPDASYRQARAHAREALHRADRRLDAALRHPATTPSSDEPDRTTTVAPDQPDLSTTGAPDQPDVSTTGASDQPDVSTTGASDQPDVSTTGAPDRPDLSTAGARDEPDRAMLHDARKAYKRARYAAEALAPVAGEPADRLVHRLRDLQDVLGDLHDAWLAAGVLQAHAAAAQRDGESPVSYEVLAAHRTAAANDLLALVPRARRRARRPGVRRWLERR
ncbi:CHAD domain-containing protein [Actinocatenispora sera]|nr:CHAD domain-containing protein [Actinocatenispora sera]